MQHARRRGLTRPLLAVAAVSLAACGSTAVPPPAPADPVAVTGGASPPAPAASAALLSAPQPAAATPRVTPNGRPACGNVTMRAPSPPDCDRL